MSDEKFHSHYEKYGDVLYVDLAETPTHAKVSTADVGEETGFPGQITVRFNPETGVLYGFVIEGYKSVERELKKMAKAEVKAQRRADMEAAFRRLVEMVREAFSHLTRTPDIHAAAMA